MKLSKINLKVLSFLFASLFLFTNCSKYTSEVGSFKDTYSGEDIYKSIYFGIGDFSTKISLLKGNVVTYDALPHKAQQQIESNAEKIIDIIKSKDAKFFNRFQEDILSKNHLQIEHALKQGATSISENIQMLFPEISKQLNYIDSGVKNGKLNLKSKDQLKNYLINLKNDSTITSSKPVVKYPELLAKNMISSGQTEESVAAASVVWAVAAAVYFAVAAHNTVAVTAMIYYKAAFWGPSIDKEVAAEVAQTFDTIIDNDLLKAEMLINEIATL
jgi:SdpC family antimicrobial peptide